MTVASLFARLRRPVNQDMLSPLTRRLLFGWRRRITPGGRALFGVLLVTGMAAASLGTSVPMYLFPVWLFGLLAAGRVAGLLFSPKLSVERELPVRCAAGAALTVRAQVQNLGRFPVFDLAVSERHPHWTIRLEDEPEHLDAVPAGGGAEARYELTPTRRGVYDFRGPIALSAFPLGVYLHGRGFDAPHRMIVYPRFSRLDGIDLPVGRKHQPGGFRLASRVGDAEEFLGNREYRPGDRRRDLDHRAWARAGTPIVREFQEEYLCRIALITDTFAPPERPQAAADLEAAISLTAAIAEVLSRREYVVDLFAAGPDLYHFQAGRSLAYLDNILDILACVEACPASPFATIGPAIAEELGQISTAVFLFLDWDSEREAFVRSLQVAGVAAKLIVVRTGEPTLDPRGWVGEGGPGILLTAEQAQRGTDTL